MFGRFELLDRIGIGGMAEVWRARVAGVGGFEKILVVKKILPAFAQNKTFVDMLLAEARLCAVLQHANIVQTYENGEIDGNYYIAMEYVAGPDLFKVLSRSTQVQMRIPTEMCLFIAAEAAKGLHYAHNAKDHYGRPLHIIHRDVSPSNIIISEAGEVKVMDFGVARATPGGQPTDNATRSGVLKGKLGYMSPEQVTGQPFDHRSDIFSLGIILYESLTLKRLFLAKTDLETLVNIRDARLEHKFKKHAYIEEPVRDVLRRALSRDVNERYPTAMAMHDDIMTLLFQQKIQVSNNALSNFITKLFDPSLQVTPLPNIHPASPAPGQVGPIPASAPNGPITKPVRAIPATPEHPRDHGIVPASQMVTAQASTDAQKYAPSSASLSFSAEDMKRIRDKIAEKRASLSSGDALADLDKLRLPPVPELAALERRREPSGSDLSPRRPVSRPELRETAPVRPSQLTSGPEPSDPGTTRTMHGLAADELRAQGDVPSTVGFNASQLVEPESYTVASLAKPNKTPLFRLRTRDGKELGPLSQPNLESMLRARTATVEDLISVNDGPFQAIGHVASLEPLVLAAQTAPGTPKLQGPLSQWMFVRLVYRMYADRATGCLELRRGEFVKSIFFRRGRTQYIASNQHNELLGPFMVQNGFISQADIDSAMQRARQTGGRLGDLLIGLNLIKPFQLYQVLERQLRAKFIDAFAWDSGTFAYYEDAAPPADIVPLDIDPVTVLAEGVRERIPLSVLEPMLVDKLDRPIYRAKNPVISVGSLKLSARESKALSSLLSASTPRAAYEEAFNNRQQRLALLHMLTLMLQTDLMTFDATKAA
jgi:serine/threonine protein kinase